MTIKFLIKRILRTNILKMIRTAKNISKKSSMSTLTVIKDMIHCAKKFGAGYNDYQEFEFYTITDKKRATFLTQTKNNEIIHRYNNQNEFYRLNDKLKFSKEFKEFTHRQIFDLATITENEFNTLLKSPKFVIKPRTGSGGIHVKIMNAKNAPELTTLQKMYPNCIIEEYIQQHNELNRIYAKSLNTLRIFTFFDGTKVHVINAVIKFGNNTCVDNFSSGGMYAFIDSTGTINTPAIDKNDNIYTHHPITHQPIQNIIIPNYNAVKETAICAAKKIPEIRYIGWDIAITETNIIIVEGNPYPGIFQKRPSFTENEEGLLSLYSKYMNEL